MILQLRTIFFFFFLVISMLSAVTEFEDSDCYCRLLLSVCLYDSVRVAFPSAKGKMSQQLLNLNCNVVSEFIS